MILLGYDFNLVFVLGRFVVGVSVAVTAHSLLQLLIGTSRFLRASSVIPSRNHAWVLFAGDQVQILNERSYYKTHVLIKLKLVTD